VNVDVNVNLDLDVVVDAVVVAVVSIDGTRGVPSAAYVPACTIAQVPAPRCRDAVRFYTVARGSALECAAIDALETMAELDEAALRDARELLERVVSMLTGLIRR
jgi:hypothetical protein